MYGFSLSWARCLDGVVVREVEGAPFTEGVLGMYLDPAYDFDSRPMFSFVYRSEEIAVARYDLLSKDVGNQTGADLLPLENPLSLRFLNARTDDQLTAFVSKYGFPKHPGLNSSMLVSNVRYYQTKLRELAERAGTGDDTTETDELVNVTLAFQGHRGVEPGLDPLVVEPFLDHPMGTKARRLAFRVKSLFDFMCMELAMVAAHNVRLTECEHDHVLFLTGSLTSRRAHARFCSDRCRVAAMRKRKAKEAAA